MKTTIIVTTIIVTLFTVFSSKALAARWTVAQDGNADFTTIQAAIGSEAVVTGDEILVYPGIYVENITVPAKLAITIRSSAGAENTIIMPPVGANGPQMCVLLRGQSTFDGFTVMENPANPHITEQPCDFATVLTNLDWPRNSAGIVLTGPATVLHCSVTGFRYGLLQECPSGSLGIHPVFRFNEAYGNDIGIACCETISSVRDNVSRNNLWIGVLCGHGTSGTVTNNLIINNGTSGRDGSGGVLCWQSYAKRPDLDLSPEITYNTISGNYGDGINCRWEAGGLCLPFIKGNIITDNHGTGISCKVPDNVDYPTVRPIVRTCNFWGNHEGATSNIARVVDCSYENPLFSYGFFLSDDSPCKDRGSLSPNWGSTSQAMNPDVGNIDLGFHQVLQTQIDPETMVSEEYR